MEFNKLKILQRLEAAAEECSGKCAFLKCQEILKNYKSERNPLKRLEEVNFLQALNLQLCQKITSTTSIFPLTFLPFNPFCP